MGKRKDAPDNSPDEGFVTLIIDDHPLFCAALIMVLRNPEGEGSVENIVSACSLSDAQEKINAGLNPDIVLLDLNLPGVNGLEGLPILRDLLPEVPILVISSDSSNETVYACLRAGAAGYIPKESSREEILTAVRDVRQGKNYVHADYEEPIVKEIGTSEDNQDPHQLIGRLTPQQLKILEFLCEGLLNKQIAYELEITETTVKAHVSAILQRLRVRNRTQAVLLAQKVKFQDIMARTPSNHAHEPRS